MIATTPWARGLRRSITPTLAVVRRDLADHLECDEAELCDFLDALAIRVGQTEAEWVSRVADVAVGACIRADNSAVGVALAWIRTWVKDTRDPRTSEQIAAAARAMGLQIENPGTVVVIQGLRPRASWRCQPRLELDRTIPGHGGIEPSWHGQSG